MSVCLDPGFDVDALRVRAYDALQQRGLCLPAWLGRGWSYSLWNR